MSSGPKKQSDLHAFFGGGKPKAATPGGKQSKLNFGGAKAKAKTAAAAPAAKAKSKASATSSTSSSAAAAAMTTEKENAQNAEHELESSNDVDLVKEKPLEQEATEAPVSAAAATAPKRKIPEKAINNNKIKDISTSTTSKTQAASTLAKRRRRVIEDDDSSDEEMQVEVELEVDPKVESKAEETETVEKETVQEMQVESESKAEETVEKETVEEPAAAKKAAVPVEKKATKSNALKAQSKATKKKESVDDDEDEDDDDDAEMDDDLDLDDDDEDDVKKEPKAKILKGSKTAASKKDAPKIRSDEEILQAIDPTWDTGLPYSVLCQAFGEIEAITSRLQIQDILTTLFRQIILKSKSASSGSSTSTGSNSQDMYPTMYLCSNTVAAAYECVELGIGDAILIKAIGEACGSNPTMVKQRYEKEGDLGTVTASFKSKQRTIGGFFKTAKNAPKKVLTVTEVLTVFRDIAKTKGNQSQKWKVEMIKKLLVRATDAVETKYIIRGLQGKLRIGLAQSTVLISLAHALALTPPMQQMGAAGVEEKDDAAVGESEEEKGGT
jgi:DNA ligase-1